ncbi:hypothetical protein Landi51_05879 [Colletotrichum acutatum]
MQQEVATPPTSATCNLRPATCYLILAVSSLFFRTQSPSPSPSPSLRSVAALQQGSSSLAGGPRSAQGPGQAETRPERSAQRQGKARRGEAQQGKGKGKGEGTATGDPRARGLQQAQDSHSNQVQQVD